MPRLDCARAASLTEFIVLVTLLAISAVGAVRLLGERLYSKSIGATIEVGAMGQEAPP